MTGSALKPHLVSPEHLDPHWRWNRAIPAHGHVSVDFERRVDFDRLRNYRLARARAALKASGCGALLLLALNAAVRMLGNYARLHYRLLRPEHDLAQS